MTKLTRRVIVGLVAVFALIVALGFAAQHSWHSPSSVEYTVAGQVADMTASQYNELRSIYLTQEFLNTDAYDPKNAQPIEVKMHNITADADKLGKLSAFKYDRELKAQYAAFRIKLDSSLSATQDLIDGKEFMYAKVYPACGNSKDFKLTSNDVAAALAPCRKVLDGITKSQVKSSDVLRNITEFRANLASVQALSEQNNPAGTALAILSTIQSKRGATDYAAYVEKQNVPASFQTLTNSISAKEKQ